MISVSERERRYRSIAIGNEFFEELQAWGRETGVWAFVVHEENKSHFEWYNRATREGGRIFPERFMEKMKSIKDHLKVWAEDRRRAYDDRPPLPLVGS